MYFNIKYACHRCGAFFIPYMSGIECPNCGYLGDEIFEIVKPFAEIASRNIDLFCCYSIPAWYPHTLADHVLVTVLGLLDQLKEIKNLKDINFYRLSWLFGEFREDEYLWLYLLSLTREVFLEYHQYSPIWSYQIDEEIEAEEFYNEEYKEGLDAEELLFLDMSRSFGESPIVDFEPLFPDPYMVDQMEREERLRWELDDDDDYDDDDEDPDSDNEYDDEYDEFADDWDRSGKKVPYEDDDYEDDDELDHLGDTQDELLEEYEARREDVFAGGDPRFEEEWEDRMRAQNEESTDGEDEFEGSDYS